MDCRALFFLFAAVIASGSGTGADGQDSGQLHADTNAREQVQITADSQFRVVKQKERLMRREAAEDQEVVQEDQEDQEDQSQEVVQAAEDHDTSTAKCISSTYKWVPYINHYSAGHAGGVSTRYRILKQAQAKCAKMGLTVCKAVTCAKSGTCTVRGSASLTYHSGGEVTYLRTCVQANYELMDVAVTSCSAGLELKGARECQDAYTEIENIYSLKAPARGLQTGSWNGVPKDCSVQVKHDKAAHWNTRSTTNNARATSGEFRIICHRAQYEMMNIGVHSCFGGLQVTSIQECQRAFHGIRSTYALKTATRGMQQGWWPHVPRQCSIHSTHDHAPHWNKDTNPKRVSGGSFRTVCHRAEYELMGVGIKTCPAGLKITSHTECSQAYWESKKPSGLKDSPRSLVSGHWNGVPLACSVQVKGDAAPHWNKRSTTNNVRVTDGEFQIICRKAKPKPNLRQHNGCRMNWEEFFGGKCYKKCSLLTSGTHPRRVGPTACEKTSCPNGADEDMFAGNCYKKCAKVAGIKYPMRTGSDKCSSASGALSTSSKYHVGNAYGNSPVNIVDQKGAIHRFYMLDKGTCCCPADEIITTKADCVEAHNALHLRHDKVWTGKHTNIPGGCSSRPQAAYEDTNFHFNTNMKAKKGRSDMNAICKKIIYYVEPRGILCPANDRIQTKDECIAAHLDLELRRDSDLTATNEALPGGCSSKNNNLLWNTVEPGTEGNLKTICQKTPKCEGHNVNDDDLKPNNCPY